MAKVDHYIYKNQKKLRCGYTTGSCAAAAAKAAVRMLLTGEEVRQVKLETPKGILLYLEIEEASRTPEQVSCAVRKDGGDDIDATHGMLIFATAVRLEKPDVLIDGGKGIGRVTRPGLACPVGKPAINPVPRRMIAESVRQECAAAGYDGGIRVEIWAPQGEAVAKRTYNPRLGIVGGISILGTSGIVEPMSDSALVATIEAELSMSRAAGYQSIVLTPGNYGVDFIEGHTKIDEARVIKCSNFIGEALDLAAQMGFRNLLLIGHIGKLIKVAGGIMNTHSHVADGRLEILTAHGALCGGDTGTAAKLMECTTTDQAVEILRQAGLAEKTMASVMERMSLHLSARAGEKMQVEAVMFSNRFGVLGKTKGADQLLSQMEGTQR